MATIRQGKKKYKLKSVTYSACQSLGSSMLMISMVIRHVWSITKKKCHNALFSLMPDFEDMLQF